MSSAPALVLRDGDRMRLEDLALASCVPSRLAKRARIVLLAADGMPNAQIALTVGVSRPTVIAWRGRYGAGGVAALEDEQRSGRPPVIDEIEVVVATLADGPWPARFLATELGISFASVVRIWRKWDIQPQRIETFKLSTDPELDYRVRDVVGLYLNPPDSAVAVGVDETPQLRNRVRTFLISARHPHLADDLVAALEVASGKVTTDAGSTRRRAQQFVRFLKKVAAAHPRVPLHVACDNSVAPKHPSVKAWLNDNPRITLHFTLADSTWLSMLAIIFGIVSYRTGDRHPFKSVKKLTTAIGRYNDANNDRCQLFTWTDADELGARSVFRADASTVSRLPSPDPAIQLRVPVSRYPTSRGSRR
jgi:transposase